MKVRRRWMSIIVIAVLSISLLAACSGNSTNETANADINTNNCSELENSQSNSESGNEVSYPKSFTYWVGLNANVAATISNLSEVGVYRELEKMTGTKVEFKHPSTDPQQAQEQFNLMIASRNLTDVIETNWLQVSGGTENAINDGVIIRLNELIDQYAPNFKAYLQQHPETEKMIKTDNGDIYAFPIHSW